MTSDSQTTAQMTRYYRIRKEVIWAFIAAMIFYSVYAFFDWWNHLNWPPHDATYPEKIKALNCPTAGRYTITRSQIPDLPKETMNSGVMNRRVFFESPQCSSGVYLAFEGSGVRQTVYVYDTEKKRRTATIVTTFSKYEDE